jgi:hypothetical protein
MATQNEWPDLFIIRAGFKPEQILTAEFAFPLPVEAGMAWCKLCDTHVASGERAEHVRGHKRELTVWRNRRKAEAERRSRDALDAHNRARREAKAARGR